eukprot:GHVQ01037203.1.p1 GENE.GHVQ01037203.1~~GHVQ01037203.1.p1  ORF type:complete len:280 (+),score=56.09 GHVQ01037203.1:547-1386(+)
MMDEEEGATYQSETTAESENPPSEFATDNPIDLWSWRFKRGGDRLPQLARQVRLPHVPGEAAESLVRCGGNNSELCYRLAEEAKEAQIESINAKQQADLLQQEKDLLTWHNRSNAKVLNSKERELLTLEEEEGKLRRRIEAIDKHSSIHEKEHVHAMTQNSKLQSEIVHLSIEYEAAKQELDHWKEHRFDFTHLTTAERRKTGDERRKRNQQMTKLRVAVNRDKGVLTKLNKLRELDQSLVKAFTEANDAYSRELARAAGEATTLRPQRDSVKDAVMGG